MRVLGIIFATFLLVTTAALADSDKEESVSQMLQADVEDTFVARTNDTPVAVQKCIDAIFVATTETTNESQAVVNIEHNFQAAFMSIQELENAGQETKAVNARTALQAAIGEYMEAKGDQHTAMTDLLDGYSRLLTESLIALRS